MSQALPPRAATTSVNSISLPAEALDFDLCTAHYDYIFKAWPNVDYFEIISENFMGLAPQLQA